MRNNLILIYLKSVMFMKKSLLITGILFSKILCFAQSSEVAYLENTTIILDSVWNIGDKSKSPLEPEKNYLKIKDGQAIFSGRIHGKSMYFQGVVKDVTRKVYDNGDIITHFHIEGTSSSHGTLSFELTYKGEKGYTKLNAYRKISHYNRTFDVHEEPVTDETETGTGKG